MTEEKKKKENEFDIFIAQSTYPDAEAVFTSHLRSFNEVKDDCVVVIDTNALLVPYATGKDSLEQIENTYRRLIEEDRLVIPGQVAREFAKNRASKLTELYQQINRKVSGSQKYHKGSYPLLESLPPYQKTLKLEEELDRLMADYKKAVHDVLDHIRNWHWNDPVSLLYSSLFTKKEVLDLTIAKETVIAELDRRQVHCIPPGYKDRAKEDHGIGDLIIWLTILEVGKKKKKSAVFVSGEEKADWFHSSESRPLYPRYELVDEYRRSSEGGSFFIIPFSSFLGMYGASESVVKEVQEEEQRLSLEGNILGEFLRKWISFEVALRQSIIETIPEEMRTDRPSSAAQMIRLLAKHKIVSDNFAKRALEMNSLRNGLVHGNYELSEPFIKQLSSVIDDLNIELTKGNSEV